MAGDYLRRGVAEFVGTFALIFAGAGSVAFARTTTDIALANGLVIAVMVVGGRPDLGRVLQPRDHDRGRAHAPDRVSLAAFYLVVQLGAAALAALLLKWVLPAAAAKGTNLGTPALGGISSGKGVAVEAVLTFFLVWVVFATAIDSRGLKQVAGLAIGLTITLDALVGLGLTGAAMNPARAFGPQLVGNHWSHFWVWYVGPIAGGAIAALLYEGLYLTAPRRKPVAPPAPDAGETAPGTAAHS